jgi:ParB-like chromosome segregation protein Spo0J
MKLSDMAHAAGMSVGAEIMAKNLRPQDIIFNPELDIFEIDEGLVESIARSMRENGYDKSEPVVVWKGEGCVVDGRTRLKASLAAGIPEIPVVEKEFEDLEEAIRYAFRRQAERRNLTRGEILEAALRLGIKDYRDGGGRRRELLAKDLGVSESTVAHARTVASRASGEDLEAIRKGEKTINQVYRGIKRNREKGAGKGTDQAYEGEDVLFSEFASRAGSNEGSASCDQGLDDPLAGVPENDEEGNGFVEPDNENTGSEEEEPVDPPLIHPSPEVDRVIEGVTEASGEEEPGIDRGDEAESREEDMPDVEDSGEVDPGDFGNSLKIEMLKSVIILLHENQQYPCIEMLIRHFIPRNKRVLFLKLFTEGVGESLKGMVDERLFQSAG